MIHNEWYSVVNWRRDFWCRGRINKQCHCEPRGIRWDSPLHTNSSSLLAGHHAAWVLFSPPRNYCSSLAQKDIHFPITIKKNTHALFPKGLVELFHIYLLSTQCLLLHSKVWIWSRCSLTNTWVSRPRPTTWISISRAIRWSNPRGRQPRPAPTSIINRQSTTETKQRGALICANQGLTFNYVRNRRMRNESYTSTPPLRIASTVSP